MNLTSSRSRVVLFIFTTGSVPRVCNPLAPPGPTWLLCLTWGLRPRLYAVVRSADFTHSLRLRGLYPGRYRSRY